MTRLLLLTDRRQLPSGRSLLETIGECVRAGVDVVVLRELDLAVEQRARLVRRIASMGAFVVAAHRPVAGAGLVQLPADAPPTGRAHGRSCHDAEGVRRAAAQGASYATLSPYAASRSKPGYGPPLPAESYAGHPIPVFALGGVEPENARAAVDAGAHGVAAMGPVMRAERPGAVVEAFLARLG